MKLSDAILGAYRLVESRWNNAAWCSEGLEENVTRASAPRKAYVHAQLVVRRHPYTNSPTLKEDTAETGWGEITRPWLRGIVRERERARRVAFTCLQFVSRDNYWKMAPKYGYVVYASCFCLFEKMLRCC